jgi:hypothetical protein
MTPRTRTSNKDANYKVYYSKKVPQQVHFPHRRRTVRRPSGAANNGAEKRQLKFLPEKMRIKRTETVGDSDDDLDEDIEKGGVSIKPEPEVEEIEEHESRGKAAKSRGKKRRSDAAEIHNEGDDEDNDDNVVRPTPKRRRQATAPISSRRSKIKVEAAEEDSAGPGPSEQKPDRSRTLRRQSTMTQMVEGRRPLSDAEEPAFRPVKRTPRLSWGGQGKKGKDKKQRTLTQMVPGMKSLELLSDDDMQGLSDAEAEERESQAYGEVIAARLAGEGLIQEENDHHKVTPDVAEASDGAQSQSNDGEDGGAQFAEHDSSVPSVVVRSVEDSEDETDEESYQPTQFIDAPVTRTKRSPRQLSAVKQRVPHRAEAPNTAERTTRRSNFSLLSTPEKRRLRVIPSSQSPADSPLSTQVSPSKASRLPLKERSSNDQGVETPTKRKQVTFNEPTKETIPPPSLRKFKSIIQDSEDEDDDLLETDENNSRNDIGQRTQALINGIDSSSHGIPPEAETRRVLDQMGQACGEDDDDDDYDDEQVQSIREPSEELCVSILSRDQYEPSPELGEHFQQHNNDEKELDAHSPYRAAHIGIKEEQTYDDSVSGSMTKEVSSEGRTPPSRSSEPAGAGIELPLAPEHVPSSPPIIQQGVEDTCPSTPMVITDSEDEQEDEPNPTPPRQDTYPVQQPSSIAVQHSADLDGELVQVPQSPPGQHQTQQSHSSKAEQQLHSEWFSYSQYVNARPTQSSSMKVAHDKFSYHATPKPSGPLTQTQTQGHFTSQATTVDEVTPRKNRTQRTISTNTTPRKRVSSQPLSSPSKPPPLFIPSSFPSPAKARMDEWSSPVLGNTQVTYGIGGSLEDFSIPLPPPVEDDWMDSV